MNPRDNSANMMQPSLLKSCTYTITKALLWLAFHSYLRLHVFGSERVPCTGPLLVASNHVSSLDPMVVGVALRRQVFLLARDSLLEGFPGWILQIHGARPIRRGKADRAAIRLGIDLLGQGRTLVLFPEGTRSWDGRLQPIRAGIGLIASRAQSPVLPVFIGGVADIMPRTKRWPRPGSIHVLIGDPLPPPEQNSDGSEGHRMLVRDLENSLRGLQEEWDSRSGR